MVTPEPHGAPAGRVLTRRDALALFSAPAVLALAGCLDGAASAGAAPPLVGGCVARPALTEGPFYLGEGPVRSDIRAGRPGVPLVLTFTVSRVVEGACAPLEGAAVDVWHADAGGDYSGVGRLRDERFLRGTQMTDMDGVARFTTVYPGWYPGRTPHVHFKVRAAASDTHAHEFASQLFFPDALSREVYGQGAYAARGPHDVTNDRDGIFRRGAGGPGGAELLLDVRETAEGYAAAFELALHTG